MFVIIRTFAAISILDSNDLEFTNGSDGLYLKMFVFVCLVFIIQ